MDDALDPRNQKRPQGEKPRILSREVFYKGTTIIRQGDSAFRAYYIEDGRVEVRVEEDGLSLKVSELGPGDIFGEMALISRAPRTATVNALSDVTVTVIARDELESRIKRVEDKAIRALINLLISRLKETTHGQIQHYKNLSDFQDRIAGVVEHADMSIDESRRAAFRKEVGPLLEDLQKVLDRYHTKDA